jgi:hypothetical protein
MGAIRSLGAVVMMAHPPAVPSSPLRLVYSPAKAKRPPRPAEQGTAIGGAPHFKRTNFPMPASAYPFGVCLTLEPFSQLTIERFVTYKLPEAGILAPEQQALFDAIRGRVLDAQGGGPAPVVADDSVSFEPYEIDFTTVGEFYHKIETGFLHIPEADLFIGPPEARANAPYVDLNGEITAVVDRASACAAIDMIVEQGEAPTAAHPDAHFVVFDTIRREYVDARAQAEQSGIPFEPVRPVVANPMTHFYDDTSGGTIIRDLLTPDVADLFNIAYERCCSCCCASSPTPRRRRPSSSTCHGPRCAS